ncbi:ionotropic receptor 21a [Diachasma alloeum]|uniref:Ionotropic receptor 21a n=1 Tax=Diachasma alloeum TaxID=454923 RepID=A0A4E0S3Q0_9HYME|nr:ionotropic receptor 21a [Diachasma alloeum]THK32945.1 ionotropic receptor 21a [Diachasma alloeum]
MRVANYIFIILLIFTRLEIIGSHTAHMRRSMKVDLRTDSLDRLLSYILKEYFGGCVIIIIYDDKTIEQQPGLLQGLYTSFPFASFIQKSTNTSLGQVPIIFKDKCYNYMIFLDDVYYIENVIEEETVNKVLLITESTPWTVKEFLKSFISRSYTNLVIITHSMSRRTEEGSFLLYTHRLYTDGSGSSKPVLLTSWIKDHMTHKNIDLFPEKLSGGFRGHRLLISTAHKPPFAIRTDRISLGQIGWDGIDIRMIRLLGKVLNFTADFRDPTASTSPTYAALMDVEKRETTLAIGGIYRTNNVTTRFDSSFSHMEDCAAFISEASLALPKYRAIMGPFQGAVWALVVIAYVIAVIPLATNTNYSILSLVTHPSRFMHMFWYVFSTFTNSFVVKNPLLDTGIAKNSTSLLIGIYWVFTIIITSCYTGSIMAFITVPVFPEPIDTAEQLLKKNYDIGTLDHDGWEVWFNWTKIDEPVAKKLLKNLQYVSTVKAGIGNITQAFFWSYAFIGSKILLEYIVQEQFTPSWATMRSPMHISKECLLNFGVTFVLPKNSIYTEEFNKVIIRARQSGLAQKIIRDVKWDVQRTAEGLLLPVSEEYKRRKIPVQDRSLALDDTQGMFLILGAGTLLAFLTLSIECCVHLWKKRYSNDVGHTMDGSTVVSETITPKMNHFRGLDMWAPDGSTSKRRRFSISSI